MTLRGLKVGAQVRIPYIEGTGSGLTRYGKVRWIDGPFVAVEVKIGRNPTRTNHYTVAQLEQEHAAYREQRRARAQRWREERARRERGGP